MSGRVVGAVLDGSKATGADLLVFVVLAERADAEGVCWPGMNSLAERCRKSERAVQQSLKSLKALGELDIEYNAGSHGTNRYRIRLDLLKPPKKSSPPPPEENITPEEPEGCSQLHPTPEVSFTPPPKPASPEPYKEPSIEPSLNTSAPRSRRAADRLDLLSDVDPQVVSDWIEVRKVKGAGPITERVINGLRREAAKAGMTLAQVIELCAEKQWISFEARWRIDRPSKEDRDVERLARWAPSLLRPSHDAALKRVRAWEDATSPAQPRLGDIFDVEPKLLDKP